MTNPAQAALPSRAEATNHSSRSLIARHGRRVPLAAAVCALGVLLSATVSRARGQCVEITPVQNVTASDPGSNDEFGSSVAISGDTIVVGAPLEEGPFGNRGAVYVYVRSGGVWTLQAKLVASDPLGGAKFGTSVGILGNTVLIGAPGALSTAGITGGAAYIFNRSGTTWTETIKLVPADIGVADDFGHSVALSSIGTRDVALIGSFLDDNTGPAGTTGGVNTGSAYVFTRNTILVGAVWTEVEKIMPTDGVASDWFGRAVAMAGSTAIIGAPLKTSGGIASAGVAYAFTGNTTGSTWTQQAKIESAEPEADEGFGESVAYVSNTAVIGAPLRGAANAPRGAAYVFARVSGVWGQTAAFYPPANGTNVGRSVSISGDWIVVGEANPGSFSGKAILHARGNGDWSTSITVPTPGSAADEQVGYAVAILGSTLAVGANVDNLPGFINAGSVYISDVAALTPASFTQHPVDSPICPGGVGSATLTVAVAGSPTVSLVWAFETASPGVFTPITTDGLIAGIGTVSGAGTTSLTVASPLFSGDKRFRCNASNACASVLSNAGTISVCAADADCAGGVTADDIFAFLDAWFLQNGQTGPGLSADFNGDEAVNADDIFAFLDTWFAESGLCGA